MGGSYLLFAVMLQVNTGEFWRSWRFWSISHPPPHPQPRKI